jgi:predicted ribosomally synthesized peptide with SipW-like signal peptide
MRDRDADSLVTRRSILAALSATGAAGALASGSTRAYLTDSDSFGNALAAGSLDLDLCWTPGDASEPCEPSPGPSIAVEFDELQTGDSGSGRITCGLTTNSNPAWLWLRTGCPSGPCGIERAIEVTFRHGTDCGGGRGDVIVGNGGIPIDGIPLCEALTALANGVRLDGAHGPGGIDPLEAGTECCLDVEWTVVGNLCGGERARLEFDFHAEQARHNDEPQSPWTPRECLVDCTVECDDCAPASFVAFCTDEGTIPVDAISSLTWTGDSITWTSTVDLDSIVLYYGPPTFETYAPPDGFAAGEEYSYTRTDQGVPRSETGQEPSDPCPGPDGCGVKFNFPDSASEEGVWNYVCDTQDSGPKQGGKQ